MENNSTCLISSLAILSPCLFAITATDSTSVNHSITEAQSELVRVRIVMLLRFLAYSSDCLHVALTFTHKL